MGGKYLNYDRVAFSVNQHCLISGKIDYHYTVSIVLSKVRQLKACEQDCSCVCGLHLWPHRLASPHEMCCFQADTVNSWYITQISQPRPDVIILGQSVLNNSHTWEYSRPIRLSYDTATTPLWCDVSIIFPPKLYSFLTPMTDCVKFGPYL